MFVKAVVGVSQGAMVVVGTGNSSHLVKRFTLNEVAQVNGAVALVQAIIKTPFFLSFSGSGPGSALALARSGHHNSYIPMIRKCGWEFPGPVSGSVQRFFLADPSGQYLIRRFSQSPISSFPCKCLYVSIHLSFII